MRRLPPGSTPRTKRQPPNTKHYVPNTEPETLVQAYRQDYDTAEVFYKRSLLLKPDHVPSLCSYSTIMIEQYKVGT